MGIDNTTKFYPNKNVFVTGQTGFKGAWLCWWLTQLGSTVTSATKPPEDTRGNLYTKTNLASHITSHYVDLADYTALKDAVSEAKPEIVFHLAAQPLVLTSYDDPIETYQSNAMGTVHLLNALRDCPTVKSIVVITTDKCYENKEWEWPYRETDPLGGHDPYSSSKAMAEIATSAYYRSFFKKNGESSTAITTKQIQTYMEAI